VRTGSRLAIRGPRLYLLLEDGAAVSFPIKPVVRRMQWLKARAIRLRISSERDSQYYEDVESTDEGAFVAIRRRYWSKTERAGSAVVTPDARLAMIWSNAAQSRMRWREIKAIAGRDNVAALRIEGHVMGVRDAHDEGLLFQHAMANWKHISPIVHDVYALSSDVWAHASAHVESGARFVGPVWIGAGARIDVEETVVGPMIIADEPMTRTEPGRIAWEEALTPDWAMIRRTGPTFLRRASKRAFDIVCSLAALIATAPLYPIIIASIFIEDGWPVFFAHRRQTVGGREFPCYKFRTMCKNAEAMKRRLAEANAADGPQFFIKNDPRLLKVGRLLRRTQLDEAPQFWNVLLGHMSIVGPRPSPDKENQCCPAWRELRLSVRPGITGLWQIKRTRAPETDFQEWIRFDLEYVQRQSWRLDIWILVRTLRQVLRG